MDNNSQSGGLLRLLPIGFGFILLAEGLDRIFTSIARVNWAWIVWATTASLGVIIGLFVLLLYLVYARNRYSQTGVMPWFISAPVWLVESTAKSILWISQAIIGTAKAGYSSIPSLFSALWSTAKAAGGFFLKMWDVFAHGNPAWRNRDKVED